MQIPLLLDWRISIRLNKGKYSSCLNPHIGLYRPQRGGFMLRFNPDWPIWNWELNWKRRQQRKRYHKATKIWRRRR